MDNNQFKLLGRILIVCALLIANQYKTTEETVRAADRIYKTIVED